MGWLDSHLWEFEADGRRYAMRLPSEPEWNERYEDAETATLGSLLHGGVRRMEYVYDMGDYWEHSRHCRARDGSPSQRDVPAISRRRAAMPAGRLRRRARLLRISARTLRSEDSAQRKSALDWYGGPYDPDDIGEQKVITALRRIARGRVSP